MADLLMTRPVDAAQRFIAMLPDALLSELQVIHSPLMAVKPLGQPISLGNNEAVIFTSSNGVSVAAETFTKPGVTAFCLGQRTTMKAREAGWKAEYCGNTADELVADMLQLRPTTELLHLRGLHARGNVMERIGTAWMNLALIKI